MGISENQLRELGAKAFPQKDRRAMRSAIIDNLIVQASEGMFADGMFEIDDIRQDIGYLVERLHYLRSMLLIMKRPYKVEIESRSGDWGASVIHTNIDGIQTTVKTSEAFRFREEAENWAELEIAERMEKLAV